ncbi:S8 family serine peptidase [Streptacidiphilus sp. PAMC 29251]
MISRWIRAQYALGDGTSFATAYVSAAAALVRSKFPQLTAGQVINRLIKTATDPNAKAGQTTPDPHYGYGILRPDAALNTTLAAGPAAGPLQQAMDPLASGSGGDKNTSSAAAGPAAKPSGTASSSSTGLVVGIAVAVLVLLLAFVVTLVVLSRRRRRRSAAAGPVPGMQPPPPAGQSVYPGGWNNPGQQPQYQQPQYPPQYPQQAPPQYPPQAPPPPADGGGNPPDPRSYR